MSIHYISEGYLPSAYDVDSRNDSNYLKKV